jgi:hypothetical protein
MSVKYSDRSPNYTEHRKDVSAADTVFNDEKLGINMKDYEKAHIQVVPAGGADPSVTIRYWSPAKGAYIDEQTPITKAGVGVNVAYEFTVDCYGRKMFVEVSTIAAGTADVYVAGFGRLLER